MNLNAQSDECASALAFVLNVNAQIAISSDKWNTTSSSFFDTRQDSALNLRSVI